MSSTSALGEGSEGEDASVGAAKTQRTMPKTRATMKDNDFALEGAMMRM